MHKRDACASEGHIMPNLKKMLSDMNKSEIIEIEVTKYDPTNRNSEGIYTTDEWIGVSDIGNECKGKVLHVDEYLKIENKYVEATKYLFGYYSSEKIQLTNKEIRDYEDLPNTKNLKQKYFFETLNKRRTISIEELDIVTRLCLRSSFWSRLVSKKNRNIILEFGYDYYMYFKILKKDEEVIKKHIETNIGLFVRKITPPAGASRNNTNR